MTMIEGSREVFFHCINAPSLFFMFMPMKKDDGKVFSLYINTLFCVYGKVLVSINTVFLSFLLFMCMPTKRGDLKVFSKCINTISFSCTRKWSRAMKKVILICINSITVYILPRSRTMGLRVCTLTRKLGKYFLLCIISLSLHVCNDHGPSH